MSELDINSILAGITFIAPLILLGIAYLFREKLINFMRRFDFQKIILTLVAAAFLFFALNNGLPYGYFTLTRFVVCAVTAYLAFLAYTKNKHSLWVWIFGFIATLFNPIILIELKRSQWTWIDLITGIFLILSLFLSRNRTRKE